MAKKKKNKVQQISKQTFTNNPFQSLTLPFNPDSNQSDSQNNNAEESLKSGGDSIQSVKKELSDEDVLMAMMDCTRPIKNKKKTVPAAKTEIPVKKEEILLPAASSSRGETFFEEANRNWKTETDGGFIYGYVNLLSKKIFKDLKNGHIPVDDSFDLHGLTTQEAKKELQAFIVNSFNGGRRCILIIHGKGNTSRHNIAIIKEHLPSWVTSQNLSKAVLAYATALPKDGGTGAVYLLLNN